MNPTPVKKAVLAYSGGLDTSVIVPWLKENYGCDVVCFTADVGQGEELDGLEEKAIKSGASQLVIRDLKEEFASDYLFPLLRSGAVYERKYLLGTSVARPLISKHLVDVAHQVGADAIAHGATGKGNDQVRFELTAMALDPRIRVIAPWREWEIRSRQDALAYAAARGIPVPNTLKSIYSRDRNLTTTTAATRVPTTPPPQAQYPRAGDQEQTIFLRPQPVAYLPRGRTAGRNLGRARRGYVPTFRLPRKCP